MADTADSSQERRPEENATESIKLAVFCPQRPLQQGETAADVAELHTLPQKIEVASSSTILNIKQKLEQSFPGSPLAKGQTLLWHGRRLTDDEVIQQVVQGTQQPEMGYVLHLTCPADMWKATPSSTTASTLPQPFKTPSASAAERLSALSSSFIPPTPSTSAPHLPPLSTSFTANNPLLDTLQASPSIDTTMPSPPTPVSILNPKARSVHISSAYQRTFSQHFTAMSTSQRADFMGRLSRAERYYATLAKVAADAQGPQMRVIGQDEIQHLRETGQIGSGSSSQTVTELEESTEQLLEDLGILKNVRLAETRAAEEIDAMENAQASLLGGQTSSRVVYISGYPFLLQIPPQFAVSIKERKDAYIQMRKYQAIGTILNTTLGFAKLIQSSQHQASSLSAFSSQYQLPLPGRARDAHQPGGPMPPVAGIAMQPGMNRPNGLGAVGIGAQAAARLAGPGMPTARLAVVINLDEIMALAMPLLFLSIKLGFLIYVFGKHATYRKRLAMCAMAFAWVVWEGMTIHRRRRAAEARRQQQRAVERAQNRQAEGQPGHANGAVALDPPLDLNGQPQGPQLGNGGQLAGQQNLPPALHQLQERLQNLGEQNEVRRRHRNGEAGQEDARRNGRANGSSSRSSTHRQPPSRLSPKYWLYLMAKVGLSAEARDMGLSRAVLRQMQQTNRQATQNGTPVPPLPATPNASGVPNAIRAYQSQPLTVQRALRNLYIGGVLFVGTLIPEVERLRKKALLKREKKLAELELTRRQMHLASLQAELKTLEEERKALEEKMAGTDKESMSQTNGPQQGSSSSSNQGMAQSDSASDVQSANESSKGKTTAGLGIDSLQPSDSDTDLFDPPMQKETIAEALKASSSNNSVATRASSSASGAADSASAANGSAGPPRIQIDTDAVRPNDLLSPLRALQRRDENGNLIPEDDYSAPSTPLLSPAMTEDEDDRQEDGGDEDVGMILF
ncbi:hypothetical protein P389DRAFT_165469 [Cystobasidium minutum MCA 4210]|uniref:uncharacterized protein n=1 Tax=Cystobasidium minutum MCA 4210 TaxID=1397322 RepID=UPI0034CDA8C8|eukprot:jgi/Rhomi1/165469/fgenesh1_kg.1_\